MGPALDDLYPESSRRSRLGCISKCIDNPRLSKPLFSRLWHILRAYTLPFDQRTLDDILQQQQHKRFQHRPFTGNILIPPMQSGERQQPFQRRNRPCAASTYQDLFKGITLFVSSTSLPSPSSRRTINIQRALFLLNHLQNHRPILLPARRRKIPHPHSKPNQHRHQHQHNNKPTLPRLDPTQHPNSTRNHKPRQTTLPSGSRTRNGATDRCHRR